MHFLFLFFGAFCLLLIAPQDSEAQLLNVSNYNRAEREARLETERQRVYLASDKEEGEEAAAISCQSVFGSCGLCFRLSVGRVMTGIQLSYSNKQAAGSFSLRFVNAILQNPTHSVLSRSN